MNIVAVALVTALASLTAQGFLFSADGPNVILWDETSGDVLRNTTACQSTLGLINAMVLSPSKARLFTGCSDGGLRMWDASSGDLVRNMAGHTAGVSALAISPDGTFLMSGDTASPSPEIKKWDAVSGELRFTITNNAAAVSVLAVSSDSSSFFSNYLVTGAAQWGSATGNFIRSLPEAASPVTSMISSSTGVVIYSSDLGYNAVSEADGSLIKQDIPRNVTSLLLSTDESTLYLGTSVALVLKVNAAASFVYVGEAVNYGSGPVFLSLERSGTPSNLYLGLKEGLIILYDTDRASELKRLSQSSPVVALIRTDVVPTTEAPSPITAAPPPPVGNPTRPITARPSSSNGVLLNQLYLLLFILSLSVMVLNLS